MAEKTKRPDEALKKKSMICSTEAAAISIGIHLLLIILAGSWVAVHYVQKKKAELTAYTAPPKMERRQVAAPTQKMERIRQTSRRPKIVSSRAAVSGSEFALPAVTGVGRVSTQKFSTPFAKSGRDFSVLTKGLAFGIPQFKFLGVRATGEKLIFIVEATPEMLSESSGGEAACAHIKQALNQLLSELPSSVLFNVMLYNGETVASFQPEMAPVTQQNVQSFQEWIAPALSRLSPGGLQPEQNTYEPAQAYDTVIGTEAKSWARAMQAALEERPDTVFIVGRDWGRHGISREKGRRLMEFSLWEFLGGSGKTSVGGADALLEDREMRDHYIVEAVDSIETEEKRSRREDAPVQFLRNLVDYIQYSGEQILDHLRVVCDANYGPVRQAPPHIHFVRLVSAENAGGGDSATSKIRELVRAYNGELKFLNGTNIGEKKPAPASEEEVLSAVDDGAVESAIRFFGTSVKSSRIAFVLDVSDRMFEEKTGGKKSFDWLKAQISRNVRSLDPGTEFNILACSDDRLVAFAPKLKSGVDADGVDQWLAAVQRGLTMPGIAEDQVVSLTATLYQTAIGSDIHGVPLALQVAMEQRADAILVAGAGVGRIQVAHDKAQRLLDFSIVHSLGVAGDGPETVPDLLERSSDGMLAPLDEDQEQWREVMLQAVDLMDEDNERRDDARLPLGFVRDLFDYIQYTPRHILDHLQTVSRSCYPVRNGKVDGPQIHFAKLMDRTVKTERKQLDEFREFAKVYESQAQLVEGAAPDQKKRESTRYGAVFSPLPKRTYLGLPKFKYLDVRANGEKLVFILDGSRAMLAERSGGEVACSYIKRQLVDVLSKLPASVDFNVMVHDGETVAAFQSEMIPVNPENVAALKEWLVPLLNPLSPGLTPEQNTYEPQRVYDTALDVGARSWTRAMQAALEEGADTIFVVGRDWGRHDISRKKGQGLMDFSLWELLGGSEASSIAENPVLLEDREIRDDCIVDTVDLITRLGPDRDPFVHNLPDYMQYSGDQIIDHLSRVCLQNYLPLEQGPPQVHWVRLVSEDDVGLSDPTTRNARVLVRRFDGSFAYLDGEKIRDKYAGDEAEEELADEAEEPGESRFKFFGIDVDSSSVAFVLDASDEMFDEETGGGAPFYLIKKQIEQMVRTLTPDTRFNILVCNEKRVVAFTPEMRAGFDSAELVEWLAAVQYGLEMPDLPAEKAGDVAATFYNTAIGADIKGLPLAMQVAMEQNADAILVAEAGMGHLPVKREKARRLLDFAILKALGPRGTPDSESFESSSGGDDEDEDEDERGDLDQSSGGAMVAPLQNDQLQFGQLMSQAFVLIEEENEERDEQGLSLGFVRDIFDYIEYTPAHIFKHLTTVGREVYPVEDDEVKRPKIHFAKLIDSEAPMNRKMLRDYNGFKKYYESEIQLIRGASTEEDLRDLNRALDLYD